MGHIKFWKMANTFTGLKLQGTIGKFGILSIRQIFILSGLSELSDIVSYVHLADGKVLSSAESGNLLLWDGGMIKCEIGAKEGKPCHPGGVEVVIMEEGEIVTGGKDGFIRMWDLETIDNVDPENIDEGGKKIGMAKVFEMEPLDEIFIGKGVLVPNRNFVLT